MLTPPPHAAGGCPRSNRKRRRLQVTTGGGSAPVPAVPTGDAAWFHEDTAPLAAELSAP